MKALKIIIPIFLVVVIGVAFAGGMLYYSERFIPGTTINGVSYSGSTVDSAYQQIARPKEERKIAVLGSSGAEELVITDHHYAGQIETEEIQIIKDSQNNMLWFLGMFRPNEHTVQAEFELDEAKVKDSIAALNQLIPENMTLPQDAHIVETKDGYVIAPETVGTTIDKEKFEQLVFQAIKSGENTIDLAEAKCYLQPTILADDPSLVEPLRTMNALGKLTITYDFFDQKETLDYEKFSQWVKFSPEEGIQVDEDQAKVFISSLAGKYNTVFTERNFRTNAGNDMIVGGGIYGWQLNINATAAALIEHIKAGESVQIEPVYTTRGLYRNGKNDIGNTYIEIDITKQTMWFYKNGKLLVETGVVTGLLGTSRETPTGVFSVWAKQAKRYISGDDYKFWVEVWIPIDWTGVGIHDASWQSSFGGDAYSYRGSHGCINTPYEQVYQIFTQVEENTPVIIYKS